MCSRPIFKKRLLTVDDDEDSQRESQRSYLKRLQHDVHSRSISASRSSSRSSEGRSSSLNVLSAGLHDLAFTPEEGFVEPPPECTSKLPYPRSIEG